MDTDWGKAAWLSYTSIYDGTANSWYRITLGYYHCSADAPVSGGIYRVTLKIKGELTDAGTVSKLVFTCRNADNDASFAAGTNPSSFTATMATVTPDEAATWQDYTFYVDFSKKATNVGSNITFSDTEASDYAAFDLRIYTNDAGTETVTSNTAKIYISDVVMEAYTE